MDLITDHWMLTDDERRAMAEARNREETELLEQLICMPDDIADDEADRHDLPPNWREFA